MGKLKIMEAAMSSKRLQGEWNCQNYQLSIINFVGTIKNMELDPHTLQLIIHKISQQMRCPQCGKHIPIDFTSVRIAGDDFLLLQLRCDTCDAYIVLHASLRVAEHPGIEARDGTMNVSSSLNLREGEIDQLREALKQLGGSFESVFKKFGGEGIEKGKEE